MTSVAGYAAFSALGGGAIKLVCTMEAQTYDIESMRSMCEICVYYVESWNGGICLKSKVNHLMTSVNVGG